MGKNDRGRKKVKRIEMEVDRKKEIYRIKVRDKKKSLYI